MSKEPRNTRNYTELHGSVAGVGATKYAKYTKSVGGRGLVTKDTKKVDENLPMVKDFKFMMVPLFVRNRGCDV